MIINSWAPLRQFESQANILFHFILRIRNWLVGCLGWDIISVYMGPEDAVKDHPTVLLFKWKHHNPTTANQAPRL